MILTPHVRNIDSVSQIDFRMMTAILRKQSGYETSTPHQEYAATYVRMYIHTYVCVVATYIFSYKHGQCMCIGCHCDIVHTYPQFVVMPHKCSKHVHSTTGLLLWCMAQHPCTCAALQDCFCGVWHNTLARVLHYRTASVVYGTTPLHVCCTTGLLLWCMAQHPCTCAALQDCFCGVWHNTLARVLHYRTASVVYGTTPLHVCYTTGLLLWCMAQHPCTCAALPSRAMHPAVCTLTTAGPTQNLPQHTLPFTNTHIGLNMYTYIYTLYIYSTKKLTHAYLPCLSVPYRTHARNVVSHPQLQ